MDPEKLPEKLGYSEEQIEKAPEAADIAADLPDNYYKSRLFVGTIAAVGISLVCGNGAFSLAAPILNVINEDIGPNPNYVWIGLVNTLMLAVGYTIVGRLSDLCGRRYFFTGGNFMGVIGAIICSRASSIPVLIGGNVFLGLAASVQTSIPFVLGELIPQKHRFFATGLMYFFAIPCAVFGPAISYGFITHTQAGWRWCYYLLIITNTVATSCWFLFYHPPTFVMVSKKSRMRLIKDFDYLGFILFVGGLLIFLMGLSWGGSVYPWASGYVIGTLVTGALALVALVIYEYFATLPDPILPLHLFSNIGWVVNITIVAMAASVFYGFSLIFPQMVFGVYTNDQSYGSILSCAAPGGFVCGIILSGLSRFLGKQKYQIMVASIIATPLLGAVACATVDNKATILGLLIPGCILMGYVEGVGVTCSSLSIHDQAEIGSAVGIGATVRAVGGTISLTIYIVVLSNRLATTIPDIVPPAILAAGLPGSSISSFISSIPLGSFDGIPGVTPAIIAAGTLAYQQAQVLAFRTVFLTAIAFSGSTIVLSFFFPDIHSKMTNRVGAMLRDKKERDKVIQDIESRRIPAAHDRSLEDSIETEDKQSN